MVFITFCKQNGSTCTLLTNSHNPFVESQSALQYSLHLLLAEGGERVCKDSSGLLVGGEHLGRDHLDKHLIVLVASLPALVLNVGVASTATVIENRDEGGTRALIH